VASPAVGLTDAKIKGLKPPAEGRLEIADKVVLGLRLRIGSSGAKTFILRKRIGSRVSNMTLGRYHETRFSLSDARRKARTLLNDIEAGGDPAAKLIEEKRVGAAAGTVRSLFNAYRAAEADEKRSGAEIVRIFERYVLPEIGDRMADTISRGDVTRLIDKVAAGDGKPAPVMARAVGAQISAFYSWAMPRLDRLQFNPARDAGRPPAPKARERVLSEAELRAVWKASDAEHFPWRAAIKLLILTGQRREEVFDADRAEFDLEAGLWTIPGARAKNGNAHLVPLSRQAKDVLASVPEIVGAPKLFPSRSDGTRGPSGFSKMLSRVRSAVETELGGGVEDWRLHDLRRTLATGLQRLGIKLEVTEAVLNHISGTRSGLVGVYQRHDYLQEKRHALDAWGSEVERIVGGQASDNVSYLHA
jgi:integrase